MPIPEPSRPARSYWPERIESARRAFFDQGLPPVGLVDDGVLRSWMRCSELGRDAAERVEFQPIVGSVVRGLFESSRALLEAGRPELSALAAAVAEAGYAVLLTDRHGIALAVDGAINARSAPLRQAFRAGVDFSEAAIGTNAPVVAMREGRTARVLGAEHFYDDNHIFHCFASPVLDPDGEVAGAVDVSSDTPGMLDSALWMAERCAHRIEQRLFQAVRARLHVEIDIAGDGPTASGAWLALGDGGELLAASCAARRLMALPPHFAGLPFDQLFDERFESWYDRICAAVTSVPTRLHGGVRLRVQRLPGTAPLPRVALSHRRRAAVNPVATPCFEDERLDRGFEQAAWAFRAGLPILLTGETGCGKEVMARALHESSERAAGPFVAVNCAAIPGELLASELFGHVEGAFTGSRRSGAVGKIEAAQSGTLLLDEIGDMPLALQASLLRVLDTREVVPLGSNTARPVDANVVCATHRDLRALVERGSFREDLYYRVAGHVFHMIPLRERRDFDAVLDIVLARLGWEPDRIPAAVRQRLRAAPWPGNVRQLQHAVHRALALAGPTAPVTVADFPPEIWLRATGPADAEGAPASGGLLRRATDEAIACALEQTSGDVTAAARLLGIGRATLYRRLARKRG